MSAQQYKRAGTLLRLLMALVGLAVAGFGVAGLFLCPGLVGCLAAGLFGPCGVYVFFIALRGRRKDIQEFTREFAPAPMGSAAASGVVDKVIERIIDKV